MNNTDRKAAFLKKDYVILIRQMNAGTLPLFGKMDVQQMTEHMTDAIRLAYGHPVLDQLLTPEEHIPRMQAFLMSDKPFRENTPNVLMPDTPAPHRNQNLSIAADELQQSVAELFTTFATAPGKEVLNPFFGMLNYELTIHLLYKHAWHHLRQFGISQ